MELNQLRYLCIHLNNLSGIPTRIYQGGKQIFYCSSLHFPSDPFIKYSKDILCCSKDLGYYITPEFSYYGIIKHQDYAIIIGPTSQIGITDAELKEYAKEIHVNPIDYDQFITAYRNISSISLPDLVEILIIFNFCINGKEISTIEALNLNLSEIKEVKESFQKEGLTKIHQQIENVIKEGNLKGIDHFLVSQSNFYINMNSVNQLRQAKNSFIVNATIVSRAAIGKGLDKEMADTVLRNYLKKCEDCQSIKNVTDLHSKMIREFTTRIQKATQSKEKNELISKAKAYIDEHFEKRLSTDEIATEMNVSRPYLSDQFKKATGKNLSEYIMVKKIEHAKKELEFFNTDIKKLSEKLSFSSQSHFTRVFKKYTGITPSEYREQVFLNKVKKSLSI